MEALARDFTPRGVQFYMVYTREPHAGGDYPQPQTFDERLRYAADCRAADEAAIPVIVDDIAGTVQDLYGGLPNMVYVLDSRGKIAYRASWTDHTAVGRVVERLAAFGEARAGGRAMGGLPVWSEETLPADPAAGPAGLIKAIEVWEVAGNYDEPERFLGEEVASRFRAGYKALTGRDSVRQA